MKSAPAAYLFARDEEAQATVEYVLMAAILILATTGAVKLILAAWRARFNSLAASRTGIRGTYP